MPAFPIPWIVRTQGSLLGHCTAAAPWNYCGKASRGAVRNELRACDFFSGLHHGYHEGIRPRSFSEIRLSTHLHMGTQVVGGAGVDGSRISDNPWKLRDQRGTRPRLLSVFGAHFAGGEWGVAELKTTRHSWTFTLTSIFALALI